MTTCSPSVTENLEVTGKKAVELLIIFVLNAKGQGCVNGWEW